MAKVDVTFKNDLNEQDMFTVNLNHSNRHNVLVRSGHITIRKRFFDFSRPKGIYQLVISEAVTLPEGLENPFVLKKDKRMFSLQYEDAVSGVHEIDVKGQNVINFNVQFIPQNILDCKWKENRRLVRDGNTTRDEVLPNGQLNQFRVRYTIELFDDKGTLISSTSQNVTITLDRLNDVKPAFRFIPSEEYRDNGIMYSTALEGPVQVGTLRVSNSSAFLAAPAIDTSFKIIGKIGDDEVDGLLSLGDPVEAVNHWDREGYMIPVGQANIPNPCWRLGKNEFELRELDTNKLTIGAIRNESYVSFPVIWNMDAVTNPDRDKELTIAVRYLYKKSYEDRMTDPQEDLSNEITFVRNQEELELQVSFYDHLSERHPNVVIRSSSSQGYEAAQAVRYPEHDPITRNNPVEIFMALSNTATAGNEQSAVIIKDFVIAPPVMDGLVVELTEQNDIRHSLLTFQESLKRIRQMMDGLVVELTEQKDIMHSLFAFEGDLLDGVKRLRQNESTTLKLTYKPEYLGRVMRNGQQVYSGLIYFPYSFKYALDPDGEYIVGGQLEYTEVKGVIEFRVAEIAAREWLCLDYGSSAVVGAFGAGSQDATGRVINNLLPLKNRKAQCLLYRFNNLNNEAEKKKRNDNSESSDFLIASTSSLDGADIEAARGVRYTPKEFGKHAVCFSPSSGMQLSNINHILPCLKSLMGHRLLPDNLIPKVLRDRGLAEVKVDHIFEVVYRQLFGCFLDEEATKAQKLVMSVPNTYSPVHLETLRKIAKECMPNLRPDYTNFISESDAVACYYLEHQRTFCKNSGIDQNSLRNSNVLVFDMGAGTLDLTYFRQSTNGNEDIISIDGKMGVSKAGNYLDYVLADIIVNMIIAKVDANKNALHLNDSTDVKNFKDELAQLLSLKLTQDKYLDPFHLKDYVKNSIKPLLNKPQEKLPACPKILGRSFDSILSEYTIEDIISSDQFKRFLSETTQDVFKHFVALFGDPNKGMKIDVVIFSGRMTGIKTLRNAVKSALNIFMPSAEDVDNCRFADLASKKFIDINEDVSDVTDLKTVVVEGAMAFCTRFQRGKGRFKFLNTNVYASYGLILEKQGGGVSWIPLIDYRTKPTQQGRAMSADGMTINQYDTDKYKASFRRNDISDLIDMQGRIDGAQLYRIYLVQSYSSNPASDWDNGNKEMMTILETYQDFPMAPLSYRMTIDANNVMKFVMTGVNDTHMAHDDIKNDALRKSNWPISFGEQNN